MRYVVLLMLLFFSPAANAAQEIAADQSAARILAYFRVGQDDIPHANVTVEQFQSHLQTLKAEGASVLSLDEVINAYNKGTALSPKTVVITFDGNDNSIITTAMPLLEKYGYPFTVFINPALIDDNGGHKLTWDDVEAFDKSPLATIGIQAPSPSNSEVTIRAYYNNATARLRKQHIDNIDFLSFQQGEYDQELLDISKRYDFKAMVGQQSGVAYKNDANTVLPRFVMTEDYADQNRFDMILDTLPLPADEMTPSISHIKNKIPSIGFTLDSGLMGYKDQISCFAAGQDKPSIEWLGARAEIRLASTIDDMRFRVNCTMTVKDAKNPEILYWRWLGLLLTQNEPILEAQE